jgi:hypothetical protein
VHAIVVMHDVPPASIVTDRHIVDSVIAERRDPDATTALELSVPTESFERTTTLDIAGNRIKANTLPWLAVRDGNRVIAPVSRTQMLEWVVRSQETEVDCAIKRRQASRAFESPASLKRPSIADSLEHTMRCSRDGESCVRPMKRGHARAECSAVGSHEREHLMTEGAMLTEEDACRWALAS